MRIPLILINRLVQRASNFDVLGNYLEHHVYEAFTRKYPNEIIIVDNHDVIVGSFGGATSFSHLPHRSVVDNAKRYGLDDRISPTCSLCGCEKLAICHRIPRVYGGNLSPHNLYLDCSLCNAKQRDVLTPTQIIALLPYHVDVPLSTQFILAYIEKVSSDNE